MIAQTVGVSLFNPHAVLETVGVLGGAIAAQDAENRIEFACGVISASWVCFFMVGFGASALQKRLTAPARLWMQRGSGVLMLALAAVLVTRLAHFGRTALQHFSLSFSGDAGRRWPNARSA
jgi:L-lysine exporter family protein LysE/ArgO